MLNNGVPWQFVLGQVAINTMILIICGILSLTSGYLNWNSLFTVSFHILGFIMIIWMIPMLLNLSRSYFSFLFVILIIQITVIIFAYALHFMSAGLIRSGDEFTPTITDAIYFSVTTFTTLGYGDFLPVESQRLTTSLEALTGLISMGFGTSLIWLWCLENIVPKEMAFFDGYRMSKKNLSVGRIPIRTLTGKEKELKDWMLPPEEGGSFYYDEQKHEWLPVTKNSKFPKNSQVTIIGHKEDSKNSRFQFIKKIVKFFKDFRVF